MANSGKSGRIALLYAKPWKIIHPRCIVPCIRYDTQPSLFSPAVMKIPRERGTSGDQRAVQLKRRVRACVQRARRFFSTRVIHFSVYPPFIRFFFSIFFLFGKIRWNKATFGKFALLLARLRNRWIRIIHFFYCIFFHRWSFNKNRGEKWFSKPL